MVLKVNKLIKKYNIDGNLVSKPCKQMKDALRSSTLRDKHANCDVCAVLPDDCICDCRYVVYCFTCKFCGNFYIGQTARPFYIRYYEHSRSIDSRSNSSALSEHIKSMHRDECHTILDYDIKFLSRHHTAVEARIEEASSIGKLRPTINRRHELTSL